MTTPDRPAPCAKFCEAQAFYIEIRRLTFELENSQAERDRYKNERDHLVIDMMKIAARRVPLTCPIDDFAKQSLADLNTLRNNTSITGKTA